MKPYDVRFTKEAVKDVRKLSLRLKSKMKDILLSTVSIEPKSGKRLVGDLKDFYSIRVSYKDRIVYSIDEDIRTVFIHRARTHYGD